MQSQNKDRSEARKMNFSFIFFPFFPRSRGPLNIDTYVVDKKTIHSRACMHVHKNHSPMNNNGVRAIAPAEEIRQFLWPLKRSGMVFAVAERRTRHVRQLRVSRGHEDDDISSYI
jgi:hypothetical protein